VGGMAATWSQPPALLASPASDPVAAVTQRQFDDSQLVILQLATGPDRELQAPGNGRITSFGCIAGGAIESGSTVLSINGVPAISLATHHPLWRDLRAGNSGADVRDLADELVRLGFLHKGVSKVDKTFLAAWTALEKATGISMKSQAKVISMSSIVWLPADNIPVASCDIEVGSIVSTGQKIASLMPTLTGASLIKQPVNTSTMEYQLVIDQQSFTLDATGAITNSADLDRLATLPSVVSALGQDGSQQVLATYSLAQPVQVSVVPPSAVVVDATGNACVMGDGKPQRIEIVGSQLGHTFVTFTGDAPQYVATMPPRGLTCG